MLSEAERVERPATLQPLLDLRSERLSASSLKLFYEANKVALDADSNGYVDKEELVKFKAQRNPISQEYRLAESLSEKLPEIQALSRDEGGFLVFSDTKGVSAKDIDALDARAQYSPTDKLTTSINDSLASRDYEDVLRKAQELTEERLHLVDLKFKKHSFSLDPFKHLGNELKAEHKTTLVGERQFGKYEVGQTLSNKVDGFGILFNGTLDSYSVSVSNKRVETTHYWTDAKKNMHPISPPVYEAIRDELQRHGRSLIATHYAGSTHNYISDRPISEMNIVSREPHQRFFVDVEIRNSSLSLDLTKHIRNASTKHRIELEVPQKLYEDAKNIWDPKLNAMSFLLGGRLSSMHGEVKRKWTEVDPDYEKVVNSNGYSFVIPKRTG
ncbi:MAG: hypothetical protein K2X77_06630 [Candidatus Obscuribacterales bacterium]|nr:hypothetical protein [Candidatus Obscuribacterales bacterium]